MSEASGAVRTAMAERMNRLTQVRWDRCVMHDASACAYGWVGRSDGGRDFVLLDFTWGTTTGFDGEDVPWFSVGCTTSSAKHSAAMNETLGLGGHKDCERVEDVFGEAVACRAGRMTVVVDPVVHP